MGKIRICRDDNVITCEIKALKITNNQSEARMSLDNP